MVKLDKKNIKQNKTLNIDKTNKLTILKKPLQLTTNIISIEKLDILLSQIEQGNVSIFFNNRDVIVLKTTNELKNYMNTEFIDKLIKVVDDSYVNHLFNKAIVNYEIVNNKIINRTSEIIYNERKKKF